MEYIANSSVSYEDVEYDAVLIHSRSQGDKNYTTGAAEQLQLQEGLIQLGQHHIKRLREERDKLKFENEFLWETKSQKAQEKGETLFRDGKTLVVVEADYFDCPVCYSRLENPHTLSCGHVFCQQCLERWFRRLQGIIENKISVTYTCPKCTAAVTSPPPPAYVLRAVMDALQPKEKGTQCAKAPEEWVGLFSDDF